MTVASASPKPGEVCPRPFGMSDNSDKKKAKKPAQEGVLGTLPATRPARVGRARTASARPARTSATATNPARPKSAKPRTPASESPVKPPPRKVPKPPPLEPPSRRGGPPTGADLAVTAARAVGELAQIGATAGARAFKRAASRLPRP
jgi:hypothetical protein